MDDYSICMIRIKANLKYAHDAILKNDLETAKDYIYELIDLVDLLKEWAEANTNE